MTVVVKFMKWVGRVWRKMSGWVLFWRCKKKPVIPEYPKKHLLRGEEKTSTDFDTVKLVKSHKESKVSDLDECPGVPEPSMLTTVKERPSAEPRESRSLLRLSQTVVQSVSTIMVSALQSGWRLCRWKSSRSSASFSSRRRTQSALETPEAEMLREVYLVLWVIRKQLRELARRQERHRRRHLRSHISGQLDPVQGLKPDARSPF